MARIATPTGLVDHLGRPIDSSLLREEIAGPTTSGVRSIVAGHPAAGLTPGRLSGILKGAEMGDQLAYLELAEEMEEKDLHYLGVLGTRKRQVAQLEITVEAATDEADDQANADLVREWLNRDSLQDDLFDIMDAVGKGFSVTELIWSTSESQWWPERLELVDPRWTEFDRVNGRDILLRQEASEGLPLPPFKFIVHRMKAKSGLTIRGGLARHVAWAWMFKNYTVKDWVAFAEIYGMPFRVGKYDGGATLEERRTLLRAVSQISTDAAAIIPKSMEIEFIDGKAGAGGDALFEKTADWFDRQVSKAVLGQTGTTDMQKGGGYAQSKTLDGVREDIEQADAKSLAATLNRDLVRPLVDLNRGQPAKGRYPKIAIGRAEGWDPTIMMPAVESFVRLGGRVGMSTVQDRLGLPDPGADEEVLTVPAPAPAADPKSGPPGAANDAGPKDGPKSAQAASTAFLSLLKGKLEAKATGAKAAPPKPDAIDDFIARELDVWEALAEPLVQPIETVLAGCSTLEEARERLLAAVDQMDPARLGELLATAGFNARPAGAAGAHISPEEIS